jgi:hypothetical protein
MLLLLQILLLLDRCYNSLWVLVHSTIYYKLRCEFSAFYLLTTN